MTAIEDRLRAELGREAARFQPSPAAWARLQREARRSSGRWLPAAAAAVVVSAAVTGTVVAVRGGHHVSAAAPGQVCATAAPDDTILVNPGFDEASLGAHLAGGVLCVRAGNQYWGTRLGGGELPAAGLTSMALSLDGAGRAESLVTGVLGVAADTVQLTDPGTHRPLAAPVRYATVQGRRVFLSLTPQALARVEIAVRHDGQVARTRTVTMQQAGHLR